MPPRAAASLVGLAAFSAISRSEAAAATARQQQQRIDDRIHRRAHGDDESLRRGHRHRALQLPTRPPLSAQPPPNDECASGTVVPPDSLPYVDASGTTVNSLADFDAASCGAQSDANGVWYRFAPAENTVLVASVDSGLGVRVYLGGCDGAACVAPFDDELTFVGVAGVEYGILVSRTEFSPGTDFTFRLSRQGDGDGDGGGGTGAPTLSASPTLALVDAAPSGAPSSQPSAPPSVAPTSSGGDGSSSPPSGTPSSSPSVSPSTSSGPSASSRPSSAPSEEPSTSAMPSNSPTGDTVSPATGRPTFSPTFSPTPFPVENGPVATSRPTLRPTPSPTRLPVTDFPTTEPPTAPRATSRPAPRPTTGPPSRTPTPRPTTGQPSGKPTIGQEDAECDGATAKSTSKSGKFFKSKSSSSYDYALFVVGKASSSSSSRSCKSAKSKSAKSTKSVKGKSSYDKWSAGDGSAYREYGVSSLERAKWVSSDGSAGLARRPGGGVVGVGRWRDAVTVVSTIVGLIIWNGA